MQKDNLSKLQEIIGYEFKNADAIKIAISHPGLKKGSKTSSRNFERLELLGDRVLGLSLAGFLYKKFPTDSEGALATRIAALAGTDFLIAAAKKTKIIDCFSIPKDFFVSERKNSSAIADMMEAVFGAVFLDAGFETTQKIIAELWKDDIENVVYKEKDPKTQLQEIVQARSSQLPIYKLVKTTGEPSDPIFEIEVSGCGASASGCGGSKKLAERDAAFKLLTKIRDRNVEL
ncbi:MAG: ribonuclease III [Holosporaceae bacterium]|jgi:ribonuclease-3|nr:ribonuclease III [Holosporaceae bacterium]